MTLNFTGKENAMITIYVKTVIHNQSVSEPFSRIGNKNVIGRKNQGIHSGKIRC